MSFLGLPSVAGLKKNKREAAARLFGQPSRLNQVAGPTLSPTIEYATFLC